MLSEKDLEEIVFNVTEKVLLRIPEVIGNLMMNHAEMNKLTKDFHAKNPEFMSDPLTVSSVTGQLERENAGMSYEKILELAAPLIKKRMNIVKTTDFNSPKKTELNLGTNGEI